MYYYVDNCMDDATYSKYNKALKSIVKAYETEDYDAYESRIERASKIFHKSYGQVEDDATDYRMFGEDANDFLG